MGLIIGGLFNWSRINYIALLSFIRVYIKILQEYGGPRVGQKKKIT